MTEPMTELLRAQGIQSAIAETDLSDPMGRESCMDLVAKLEASLGRIKAAEEEARWLEVEADMDRSILRIQELGRQIQGKNALQVEAELMAEAIACADARRLATLTPAEEAAFDALEAEAIDNAHPVVFSPIEAVKL